LNEERCLFIEQASYYTAAYTGTWL